MEAFQNGKFQAIRGERTMAVCKNKKEILASSASIGPCDTRTSTLFNRRFGYFALRLHTLLKPGAFLKVYILIFMVSFAVFAETGAGQAQPQASPQQVRPANPNLIPTFDEGFFNKLGETERNDSKVTSDVLAQIKSSCEGEKAKGMAAFRACVGQRQNAAVNQREKEIDRVNTQNNLPLRNTPKLIEDVQSKSVEDDND